MKPSQGGKQQTRDELVAAGETGAIAAGALASVRHLKESRVERDRHQERAARLKRCGMKVDVEGNVYCGGAGGLWIMDPHGKKLGRIVHGAPATTNLAFGGDDWKTLYFTSRNHLGAINMKIPGVPVPPQKR